MDSSIVVPQKQTNVVTNGVISSSAVESELARVNKEMYERNVELAIRNKTLSVLGKIYEIINTSLGVSKTAQKVIEAIVNELNFQGGAIAMLDSQNKNLQTSAIYHNGKMTEEITKYHEMIKKMTVSLENLDNYAVKSVVFKKTRLTNSLYDLLVPMVSISQAESIQKTLGVATMVIYPLSFANVMYGVFVVSLAKHVGDLSRAERETLRELIEVVGIAIDRAKLYADLKDANEKLKALDKLKDDFVSVASHELRTPMTAIKSYLWMAIMGKGGALTEKQKYYLDRAYNSTDRLIRLVNDMLNISRIESGRMTYDMKEVDLVKLIGEVITDVKPRSDELGIEVKLQQDYSKLEHVLADADKIKEVIFNLVGNSLKFTPKDGHINIELETLRLAQGDKVECRIIDDGAGISPEDMEKLFQKFGLLAGSYTVNKTDQQGTGLGLFITKSILEAHKGNINAKSDGVGKGSTFMFTLPIYDASLAQEFEASQAGKEKVEMIHSAV